MAGPAACCWPPRSWPPRRRCRPGWPTGSATLADAQAWAAEIAGLAPLALQAAKRVLNDDGAYEEQWPAHKELFDKAWGSQDVIEAQVARIEKRPPRFQGA